MKRTKIEWADSTFNPITGCWHGCDYCYARKMAARFKTKGTEVGENVRSFELAEPVIVDGQIQPYPFNFIPTFHKYKLEKVRHWKNERPKNIFVGSMADMFGIWIPDDWIIEVLEALRGAPQHQYLFLTKDPIGYNFWPTKKHPEAFEHELYTDNMWLGLTFTGYDKLWAHMGNDDGGEPRYNSTFDEYFRRMNGNHIPTNAHRFLSIEPILTDVCEIESGERKGTKLLERFIHKEQFAGDFEWVIVGAETGNRQGKVVPKREWIEKLVQLCKKAGKPVFMKDSLVPIIGEESMLREVPEELKHDRRRKKRTVV